MLEAIFYFLAVTAVVTSSETYNSNNNNQTKENSNHNSIKGKFIIVENLSKARSQFPKGAEFSLLDRKSDNQKGTIVYTLGRRTNGDKIVATESDGGQWTTAKDIQLLIEYPEKGQGAVVTYVVVLVDQSSNVGDGYVVSGGIGQRHIGFVIEAKSSTYMNYDAFIYGK